MASKYFVYSTLTNDQRYINWSKPPEGSALSEIMHEVFIAGGSNRATKHFVTPLGVMTEITEQDYAELQKNSSFKNHEKNGYITVRDVKVDPEVAVAADMKQFDNSAPKTPMSVEFAQKDGVRVQEKAQGLTDKIRRMVS